MTLDEAMPMILATLGGFLKRTVNAEELADNFEALGADSMDMVALAFELETLTGRSFEPELFLQHPTVIEALQAYFAEPEAQGH